MSLVMTMSSLRYRFPLDHKNLMFMVLVMIMFMIVMSLVDTKPYGCLISLKNAWLPTFFFLDANNP